MDNIIGPPMAKDASLRDYFAARAPEPPAWWLSQYPHFWSESHTLKSAAEHLTKWNYEYADAMIAARNR